LEAQRLPEQGLPDLSARRSRLLGDSRRGLLLSTTSTVVVLAALVATGSGWTKSGQTTRTGCPADSSSGSRSFGRWPCGRG